MTFQDIAQQSCDLVGENDSNSLAFAENRAKDSYRIIWNSFAWPETIRYKTIIVPASVPSIFTDFNYGEILASSWAPNGGNFQGSGVFQQGSTTVAVANTGVSGVFPVNFLQVGQLVSLPGVVQQGATVTGVTVNTSMTLSSPALANGTFTFTATNLPVVNPIPGVQRDYEWVVENAPAFLTPNITSIVPHFFWKAGSTGVPLDPLTPPNPILFEALASAESCQITIHGEAIEPVSGMNLEVSEIVNISTSAPNTIVSPVNNFSSIYSISKTAGNGNIIVLLNNQTITGYVMQALDGRYEFNCYNFLPPVNTTFFWNLQLKLRPPEFSSMLDSDTPAIQHLEDTLMAYTQSALLERQRQYNKAQQKLELANLLQQGAKDMSRNQEQKHDAIVPDVYDITNLNGWRTRRRTSSFF